MDGRDFIRGMRILVSVIVDQIADDAAFDEILAGYPRRLWDGAALGLLSLKGDC